MDKKLPIYDIVLSEDDLKQGVGMISLVDDPAIKVNWIKLAKQTPLSFKSDKEKQMLYGPFLIPNMLIYRSDEHNGEYYVRFSKEEIDKIATKFNEDLNNKNINFMHSDVKVDAFVASNWLIDGEQDKSKNFGFDLPEGTWFGGVKVKDQNFWQDKVKSEEVKGFSVEILADLELSLKNKEQVMKKEVKLGSAYLVDGTTEVYWEGDMLEVGGAVFLDEAMTQPAPDGIHMIENGDVIKVTDGKVEIYAPGLKFDSDESLAAYPWDQCIEDQMKQYGDKDIAEAVCGKIKSENMTTLAGDGPCYEGYEMVGMKIVDGKEVPNCVPVKDGQPAPAENMAVEPGSSQALTAEEVSGMIDSRFSEIMDELTRLKSLLEEKDKAMTEYKRQIDEKFSSTPATASIKKPETKVDDKFATVEARIREFAKNSKR